MSCLDKVVAFIKKQQESDGVKISERTVRDFAKKLDAIQASALSPQEFQLKATELLENHLKVQRQRLLTLRKMELVRREQNFGVIRDNIETGKVSPTEAFRNYIEGGALERTSEGNRSLRGLEKTTEVDVLGPIWRQPTESFRRVLESGELRREFWQELHAIQTGGELGKSGSDIALRAAKAFNAMLAKTASLKQALNPLFESLDEYMAKNIHNRLLISNVERDVWVADIMKSVDLERTFPDAVDVIEKRATFEKMYDRIKSGQWGHTGVYEGGRDILRSMTHERKIHFKDWQSLAEYNQKYGYQSIEEVAQRTIQSSARDLAQLTKFGARPGQTFDDLYKRILRTLPDGPQRKEFETSHRILRDTFESVMGVGDAPASTARGRFVQGVLSMNYLSLVGRGALRTATDIPIAAMVTKDTFGGSLLSNAVEMTSSVLHQLVSPEHRKKMAREFGTFSRFAVNEIARQMGGASQQPGMVGRMADLIGKANFLQFISDVNRNASAGMFMRQLGEYAAHDLKTLGKNITEGMRRYGIYDKEWDVIRSSVDDIGGDGHINYESIHKIEDDRIELYLRQTGKHKAGKAPSRALIDATKYDLATKVGTMLNEHADFGSSTMSDRTKAFLYAGRSVDDWRGQLARLVFQFKSASFSNWDAYRRAAKGQNTLSGRMAVVASAMSFSMFYWAMGDAALQIFDGKTPENPMTIKYATRAALMSNAVGMYSDMLAQAWTTNGGYSDRGRAMMASTLGPTASLVYNAAGVVTKNADKALQGKSTTWTRDLVTVGGGMVPGQNLFWLKGALNYYFINDIKEFLGPGYLQHQKQEMSKKGQSYWLPGGN